MGHEYKEPKEGFIFRNKANPDDFSSALYIGFGRSADEWEEVPIAVHEEYQAEQQAKMLEAMGINPVESL
jgi:hypothetical protein